MAGIQNVGAPVVQPIDQTAPMVSGGDDNDAVGFFNSLAQSAAIADETWASEASTGDLDALLGDTAVTHQHGKRGSGAVRETISETLAGLSDEDPEVAELALLLSKLGPNANLLEALSGSSAGLGTQILALYKALSRNELTSEQRENLTRALALLLGDPEWALSLFAATEFGKATAQAMPELRDLYRFAAGASRSLVAWFKQIRNLPNRQRKLKVIIHALGAELADEVDSTAGVRMAAVVQELKRVLVFLGMEDYCTGLAEPLGIEGFGRDGLMQIQLEILDEEWLFPETITDQYEAVSMSNPQKIRYVRALRKLTTILPDLCFRDIEQRHQIQGVIESCEQTLAEFEDEQ